MKKNRASGILKLIAALRSMAKSNTLALKSKTNAIKARLVIFSLVMNKRYVMSTISDKFQSLLGHSHNHSHLKEVEDDNNSVENKCIVVINANAHLHEADVPTSSLLKSSGSPLVSTLKRCETFWHAKTSMSNVNPDETQIVMEDKDDDDDGCEGFYTYDDEGDGDGNKYPDLTHTMFESEDLDIGGSVIDLVKSSKEEAGQEFKMEEEIDLMADLFIRKFRRQIMLQEKDSLKMHHEMQLQ